MWSLHLYSYDADLSVDGVPYPIRPGSVSLVPPAAQSHYRYRGPSDHLYAHLRLTEAGERQQVPVMQEAGVESPTLAAHLRQALTAYAQSPARATAEVWAALWRVARLGGVPAESGPAPVAVARAVALIEARLVGPLSVADIARETGISHNHLTRLFQEEMGKTVVAYVRERRMERARHLLRETTMSIPAIAASVGIADLQAFNKTCRREFGVPPRQLRFGENTC
ncbi:helix-turn-helix transcriptional regulator [Fodinicola feengrottensis]|uniref:helix-turn-helix transcriptional regulator n=1 Tax=Fodinicola feengrottensis TaxID=435914 RepID=UPI0024427897|nr:helix-turn-helix transcriptional regulator [Fodinicola feengrottensis]